MRRKQFTFYESFFRAISYVEDDHDKLALYETICSYALTGEAPDLEGASGTVRAIFEVLRPNLDAGIRKAEGGTAGSTPDEAAQPAPTSDKDDGKIRARSNEDTENKIENKKKVKTKDKVKTEAKTEKEEKAGEKEKPDEWGELRPRVDALPLDVRVSLEQWLQYKAERRERYKPTGLKALVGNVEKACALYGPAAVCARISECMGAGYQGLTFDRLARQGYARGQPRGNPFAGMLEEETP